MINIFIDVAQQYFYAWIILHSLLGIQKVLKYFDVASWIFMHSIVLTSTLVALNDPSYMYAAVWAHIFLLYPYKMHFHTF